MAPGGRMNDIQCPVCSKWINSVPHGRYEPDGTIKVYNEDFGTHDLVAEQVRYCDVCSKGK